VATFKKSKYLLSSMVTPASDGVRQTLGSYWLVEADGKFKMQTSSIGSVGKFTSAKWGEVTINQEYEAPPYYTITQSVTLISDSTIFENPTDFKNYVIGDSRRGILPLIMTGTLFGDATILLPIPYSREELMAVENSVRPLHYSVDPTYNFYQEFYEGQITTAPEQILPNLYSVYESKTGDEDLSPNSLNDLDSELVNIGGFLGEVVSSDPTPETDILPIENVDFVKEANPYKRLFPMYNEINFSTQTTTNFAEILEDARLSTEFLEFLQAASSDLFSFTGFKENLFVAEGGEVSFVASNGEGSFNVHDVFGWWKSALDRFSVEQDPTNRANQFIPRMSFIGPNPPEINKFTKFLYLLTFEGKMQKMVNKYLRSYTDILKGCPSYSETVAYKVEKRKSGDLIATYIFPNSNEIDVYRFVDTQVKYGQPYQYDAFAYQLVLGSEYMYDNVMLTLEQGAAPSGGAEDSEDDEGPALATLVPSG